ncbi:hypothetical protein [Neorhizobium sp. JUb45]|uniref:hypothetical protein n=1 Tax=Neorhizobium sp. JUb45 TaxID=2485113 RepID=UPI001045B7CC|nr:hypothetical protein [Neorhizobium sp. JUb45]TCR07356.1 hypothetical protein EDF70_1011330 [Neorhizobium sp. JUb45]
MRRPNVTQIVALTSVAWLGLALALALVSGYPEGCDQVLPCLALNEWGDTLAGVFAPLAFFWLVAAVFIQSKELQAQRLELQATRDEMRHQRKLMAAQADEARNQAAFIGAQTEILVRQDAAAQGAARNADFEGALADLANLVDLRWNGKNWLWGTAENGERGPLNWRTTNNGREEIIRDLTQFLSRKTVTGLKSPFGISSQELQVARAVLTYIDTASQAAADCSPRHVALLSLLEIPTLVNEIEQLIEQTESMMRDVP